MILGLGVEGVEMRWVLALALALGLGRGVLVRRGNNR
jgi:hypothetical protein